ncbi:MAG: putative porin [Candidatus Omnitrophica bacterium]|nr:putative porin [Candidatus Omnitrophota bacterium]
MKLKKITAGLAALAMFFNTNVWADDAAMSQLQQMVSDMQKQMSQMQKVIGDQNNKIRALENREPAVSIAAPSGEAIPMTDKEFESRVSSALKGSDKWLKDLSFKGDLRLRYEAFQNSSGHPSETDDQNRFRYRLRFGFEKKFSDEIKAGFGLASGATSSGTNVDPTSTNSTFDNNFNFKDIMVEKAYATYTPNWAKVGPVEKLTVTAGKMANPFEQGSSDLIWDRDVRPEGIIEQVDIKFIDTADVGINGYALAGQFVLDEDSTIGGDAELFAWQGGLKANLMTPFSERAVDWLSAFSYYNWNDYANNSNFLIGTTSLARGNFNSAGSSTELDAEDFDVVEVYNEITLRPFGIAVKPFFDWATNIDNGRVGDADSHGWSLGTKLGGVKKKGDWTLSYAYKYIGSEVTPGFNDSDFGSLGHSGHRGSVIKAGYGLTDNIQLGTAAFFVENLNAGTANGAAGQSRDEQQRRFQLDLIWKF